MSESSEAALYFIKMCIGVGILDLPKASYNGGLIVSPILNLIVILLNGISCNMLIRCKRATEEKTESIHIPNGIMSTYSKMSFIVLGWSGVYVTEFSIIVTLLGVCITYQITFAQMLVDLSTHSIPLLTIICGVIVFPLSCGKDMGSLTIVSAIGMICLLISIGAIVGYGVTYYGGDLLGNNGRKEDTLGTSVPLFPVSLSGFTNYISVATFCVDICTPIFPVEESMRDRNEIKVAVVWALVVVWVTYVAVGDICVLLYSYDQAGIHSNILKNLPKNSMIADIVKSAMALVCVFTFPLTLVPAAQMLEKGLIQRFPSLAEHQSGSFISSGGYIEINSGRTTLSSPPGSPCPSRIPVPPSPSPPRRLGRLSTSPSSSLEPEIGEASIVEAEVPLSWL